MYAPPMPVSPRSPFAGVKSLPLYYEFESAVYQGARSLFPSCLRIFAMRRCTLGEAPRCRL